LFSWGDDFVIQDDSGQDRFFVDGKAFSLGNQLSFQDMQGNELAYIRQRLLSFAPTYEISRSGQVLATVSKELFTFFSCTFDIDLPGPNDLQAKGDFLDHQYAFERGGETVARVSKEWFAVADTYGVQVEPGEDDVLILASSVVIDMACHGDRKD
jgi:uncharacterized protein YxjI